jgi:hypothetical protein
VADMKRIALTLQLFIITAVAALVALLRWKPAWAQTIVLVMAVVLIAGGLSVPFFLTRSGISREEFQEYLSQTAFFRIMSVILLMFTLMKCVNLLQ